MGRGKPNLGSDPPPSSSSPPPPCNCLSEDRKQERVTAMKRVTLLLLLFCGFDCSTGFHGGNADSRRKDNSYKQKKASLKAAFLEKIALPPSPTRAPSTTVGPGARVYRVTDYGGDPMCGVDSTLAIKSAISAALQSTGHGFLMPSVADAGGVQVYLDGGCYLISEPLHLQPAGRGNFMIHGGSLHATDRFPGNRSLIEFGGFSAAVLDRGSKQMETGASLDSDSYFHEDVTVKDLLLDCGFRGGGIAVVDSLRTTIDNCYIAHFTTDGISVIRGHETFIRNCFIGQHITAGGDKGEKFFSGTGIYLAGNDNAVTDVAIFSAGTGVVVAGQANVLTGIHCYNKATWWGGIGIHVKAPKLSQTRIINCYLDYTGVVAEDPVQLLVTNSFFLGDAFVLLKSVEGVIKAVTVVDNMFSGGDNGVAIVQLNQTERPFANIDQVVVDRNNVLGMYIKSTVARGSIEGHGAVWAIDFSPVLLFPDRIKQVQYSLHTNGSFPKHAITNTSSNRVVVEADSAVSARVYISASQDAGSSW